jgi:antagonist of KipI
MAAIDVFDIIAPGVLSTIQDLGRTGYRHYGVAPGGALDGLALRVGNLLVDNPEGEAGIEITLMGFKALALADTAIAVTGANLRPTVDGRPMEMWTSRLLKKGQVLSFEEPVCGLRAYLAVGGGLALPPVLGSISTNLPSGFGGYEGRSLRPGDVLASPAPEHHLETAGRTWDEKLIPDYDSDTRTLRVIPGPQDDQFTWEAVEIFLNGEYRVLPSSDRTGIRLDGPEIHRQPQQPESIVSEGVMPGTIQIPGDAKPIIILGETASGGYRKIATVITADLHLLGQILPGDRVWFRAVTEKEAVRALWQIEVQIQEFKDTLG